MERLPNEIIEYILKDSSLSIVDLVNFSSTCRKFREIVRSNSSLWKVKYFERWPKIDFDIDCEDWYDECVLRRNFEKKVLELLYDMSNKFLVLDLKDISGLHLDFTSSIINSHKYGFYYLRDFLISINSLPLTHSLTNKYYGNMLLKHAHKNHCKEIWNNLIQLNVKEHTLEKGATFVSLWCQEYERGIQKTVSLELDTTANRIKQHLLLSFPDHPLKHVPEDVQSVWRNENLPGNIFQPEDCKTIIWAINYVLFKELKYYIMYDFNDAYRKESGIYNALLDRKANPLIFAVIHESVARRLGVKIEVLEFMKHCLLRWKEDYSAIDSPTHYISTSCEVIFLKSRCPGSQGRSSVPACNMKQIARGAAFCVYPREGDRNLYSVRDVLELMLVINPFNVECYDQLYRLYVLHDINAKEIITQLKDIRTRLPPPEFSPYAIILGGLEIYQQKRDDSPPASHDMYKGVRNRVEGVQFAVGMIVRDKNSGRTGVICGWDQTPSRMQVRYAMLVDDGSYEVVPQENLQILHSPPFFSHPSFGRFFDEYCMTYYKPNAVLQAVYPQEMEALQKILKRDRQN